MIIVSLGKCAELGSLNNANLVPSRTNKPNNNLLKCEKPLKVINNLHIM